MTDPRPAAGRPSRSGVRRSGDEYQDLLVWGAAMRALQPHSDITQLEVEINGVGNVDDLVLRRPNLGDRYGQAKWATSTALNVDEEFLTEHTPKGTSLLQKLAASYREIPNAGRPPTLELLTNRGLDPTHPLLGQVDGRTDLLMPYAAEVTPTSDAGEALQRWGDHIGLEREKLLEMLEHLIFRTGLTMSSEQDRAQVLMAAAGLQSDEFALRRGLTAVAEWVRGGRRVVPIDQIEATIDEYGLRQGTQSAIWLVQTIDRDRHPEDATEVLDFVDLFDGDSPSLRAQPTDQADWKGLQQYVLATAGRIEAAGWRSVLIRGAMRQATLFLVGSSLPIVRGMEVRYLQRGSLWSSDAQRVAVPELAVRRVPVQTGSDLAVVISIAAEATDAVVRYVADSGLPIADVLAMSPSDGAHDQVVHSAGEAVAYAQQVRAIVRAELERQPQVGTVHLFLASPGGLALLIGNRWNRIRPTVVYEHLGPGRAYTPAFNVAA